VCRRVVAASTQSLHFSLPSPANVIHASLSRRPHCSGTVVPRPKRILQNTKSCRLAVLCGRELNPPKQQISACRTAPVRAGFPARTGEAYCLSGRQVHSKRTHSRYTQREHGRRKRAQRKHAQRQRKARAGAPPRCVCCFVLLEPTRMLYRVPRVSPGVTAPIRSLPSRATPPPPLPYRPLQSLSVAFIGSRA